MFVGSVVWCIGRVVIFGYLYQVGEEGFIHDILKEFDVFVGFFVLFLYHTTIHHNPPIMLFPFHPQTGTIQSRFAQRAPSTTDTRPPGYHLSTC